MALKINSREEFSKEIERLVKEECFTYIDAIVFHCEESSIELSVVPKLITRVLKSKIEHEAMDLNMVNRGKIKSHKLLFL